MSFSFFPLKEKKKKPRRVGRPKYLGQQRRSLRSAPCIPWESREGEGGTPPVAWVLFTRRTRVSLSLFRVPCLNLFSIILISSFLFYFLLLLLLLPAATNYLFFLCRRAVSVAKGLAMKGAPSCAMRWQRIRAYQSWCTFGSG